jgi:hypothetical protein
VADQLLKLDRTPECTFEGSLLELLASHRRQRSVESEDSQEQQWSLERQGSLERHRSLEQQRSPDLDFDQEAQALAPLSG